MCLKVALKMRFEKKKVSILTNEYQELVQEPLNRKINNSENKNTGKETVKCAKEIVIVELLNVVISLESPCLHH